MLLEGGLDRAVATLLGREGWGPGRVVDEVLRGTPDGSLAATLVTVELICRAGYWLSRPELAGHLAEVDQMADALPNNGVVSKSDGVDFEMVIGGLHVGGTIPGWLDRAENELGIGMAEIRLGVLDALAAATAVSWMGLG